MITQRTSALILQIGACVGFLVTLAALLTDFRITLESRALRPAGLAQRKNLSPL